MAHQDENKPTSETMEAQAAWCIGRARALNLTTRSWLNWRAVHLDSPESFVIPAVFNGSSSNNEYSHASFSFGASPSFSAQIRAKTEQGKGTACASGAEVNGGGRDVKKKERREENLKEREEMEL